MTASKIGHTRSYLAAALMALAVIGTGCGPDGDEVASTSPPETTPSPTPTDTEAAAVGEIEDLYDAWWEAVIASENGPTADPALFEGIADGSALEGQLGRVQQMISEDQARVGEPKIGEPKITIDGDTARAEACVDQNSWGVVVNDQTQPPLEVEPGPVGVSLAKSDGAWIIVNRIPVKEATLTC